MNAEGAPKGAPDDLGQEVEDEITEDRGHDDGLRRYDPERYAPVSVAVWQRFPESSARAFAIAAGEGRLIDGNGTFERLRRGKDAAGSVIKPGRLPVVLEALGSLSDRQWRRYVREWVKLYVAHRCERGTVCLFTQPLPAACPACGSEIQYDHPEKPARRNRGQGFGANGRSTTARTAHERPLSGAGTSAGPALERPFVSTFLTHPDSRFNGMAVGVSGEAVPIIRQQRELGLADADIASLLNRSGTYAPPQGFTRWTGYAVRVAMGEATFAA